MQNLDNVKLDEVEELLKRYEGGDKSLLIPILQETQKAYGYLPKKALEQIAEYVNVSLSHIYGLVTFYNQFYLTPRGRNSVRVCRGTACHVRGGPSILRAAQKVLGIKEGETTSDLRFSLETVACFGACFLSPVMMVNNDYYGKLLPENVDTILEQYD
jgi:NADH-quinone oxidoreductase subunit E